ncbi:MAG TPA: gamma-glutamyltransferase, partial [Mycobacteriales bacterium]|nr:gamma-glutamyltransferase [Mycobacteriales bacterium]
MNRPMLVGSYGMTGSTHWLASAAAMSVLERGGNAFDAAAAGGFVLQVVEPHLNGPGGEVPILLWSERDQRVQVVCGQGVAPAAATIQAFEQLGINEIPGAGLLAATVPGAFGGWLLMLERWGSWPLRDVLSYAISYARSGYPAIPGICTTVEGIAQTFRDRWPTSAVQWLPGDRPPVPGSQLTNPTLADTYERIIREAEAASSDREGQLEAARSAWYDGFLAEALGRFSTGTSWWDPTGEVHSGLLTADDMAAWRPTIEEPATYDYGRYTVCKTQAWGQGPVFLAQLALLSGFDLDGMGHLSPDYLHTVVECSKLAFADREAWYGDAPGVEDLPRKLVDDAYVAERRTLVGDTASFELRP